MSETPLWACQDTSGRTLAATAVLSFFLSLAGWVVARFTAPQPEVLPPPNLEELAMRAGPDLILADASVLQHWAHDNPQVLFIRVRTPSRVWEYPRPFSPPPWALLPPSRAAMVLEHEGGFSLQVFDLLEGQVSIAKLAAREGGLAPRENLRLPLSAGFLPTLRRLQAQFLRQGQWLGEVTVLYEPRWRIRNAEWELLHLAARRTFLLFGLLYWVTLPLWVFLDARTRHIPGSGWGWLCLLTNLVGLVAYLTFRFHARPTCDRCGRPLEGHYLLCPYCGPREPEECPFCGATVERAWQWCPRCAGPLLRSSP